LIADGLTTKVSEGYTQTADCPANSAPGTGIPAATSITGKYASQTVTGGVASGDSDWTLTMTFRADGQGPSRRARRASASP